MTDFTYAVDADGVATLTWDVKAKSMNVMSTEAFALLDSLIDKALAAKKKYKDVQEILTAIYEGNKR